MGDLEDKGFGACITADQAIKSSEAANIPALPFEPGDANVTIFLAYWATCCRYRGLPVWDLADALRTIPALMPAVMVVEIASPASLPIRYAGSATRDYSGFEPTGMDLLDLTEHASRQLRFGRFSRQTSRKCGSQVLAPVQTRRGDVVINDAIWLPYRRTAASEAMLVGYLGLRERQLADNDVRPVTPMAQRFAYIDLGFGVPHSKVDPAAYRQ
jgi:hypothetical protein